MRKNVQRKEAGITLIALVVTIVVMLFLAGITIIMTVSDNGLAVKTMEAQTAQERAEVEDKIKVILSEWQIEKFTQRKTMKDFLIQQFGNATDKGDGTYEISYRGFKAIISADGDISGTLQKE